MYGPLEKDKDDNVYFRDKLGATKLLGYLAYEPDNNVYTFYRWFAATERFQKLRHWFGDHLDELFLSLLNHSFPKMRIVVGNLGRWDESQYNH